MKDIHWFASLIGRVCTMDTDAGEVPVKVIGVDFSRKRVGVLDETGNLTMWVEPSVLRECVPQAGNA